jgi:L-ascorbate metabolism protein UlaG (beta-lactamase superfamily)
VEENGKRLLVDPGLFSFIEKKLKPEDIGAVDVILLTHKHADHYYPEVLKELLKLRRAVIITNQEIAELLKQEGLKASIMKPNEERQVEGFKVQAFSAPHGEIPAPLPKNTAFLINDTLLITGDSFAPFGIEGCRILALPVSAPWARLVDVLFFAKRMNPKIVIPVHDAIIKDFMLDRIYEMCAATLAKDRIEFHHLKLGEELAM